MIKYIGSKRRLVPVLGELASARRAPAPPLDLFTGTTRVAQELKRRGHARDGGRLGALRRGVRALLRRDRRGRVDAAELDAALRDLAARPGVDGYVTETFCVQSRFFQPFNGRRIDAIRDAIEADYSASPLYPMLLTSLIEAADRVDSTTGVQMAYVKQWAPRSFRPLELRAPELLRRSGRRRCAATRASSPARLGPFDFAYLDPPYNQHRYFTNYHIWETLVAWDAPVHYGVACKRVDARDPETHSAFNERRRMADALAGVIRDVDAEVIAVSYNDESWVTIEQLEAMVAARGGAVCTLAFDSRRYVGAQIGIHNPQGEKVGTVSRLRNVEYVVVSGDPARVANVVSRGRGGRPWPTRS